jgi:hypothetical protein
VLEHLARAVEARRARQMVDSKDQAQVSNETLQRASSGRPD